MVISKLVGRKIVGRLKKIPGYAKLTRALGDKNGSS